MATLTKRQKQLLDYLTDYNSEHGYAPTLAEVGQYFGLSSLATVHKHLHNLEQKGFIKRQHNHSRALEVMESGKREAPRTLRLLGTVAAGAPIEAVENNETISVPDNFIRRDNGRVSRILADPGARVKKGSPLCAIQSPDVGNAFADLGKAEADLIAAQHDFQRQKELFDAHAGSQKDFESAEDSYGKAKAEMERSRQKARLFRAAAPTRSRRSSCSARPSRGR